MKEWNCDLLRGEDIGLLKFLLTLNYLEHKLCHYIVRVNFFVIHHIFNTNSILICYNLQVRIGHIVCVYIYIYIYIYIYR